MSLKLDVKMVGGDTATVIKTITIRNPAATVANLMASVAMCFRLPAGSFRLYHSSAQLDVDSKKLSDLGLKDGDEITVRSKRGRDEAASPDAAAEGAAASRHVDVAAAIPAAPATSVTSSTQSPSRSVAASGPLLAVAAVTPVPAPTAEGPTAAPTAPTPPAVAAPTAPPVSAAAFTVERLLHLGISRDDAEAIIRESNGDARRATELLLTGMYGARNAPPARATTTTETPTTASTVPPAVVPPAAARRHRQTRPLRLEPDDEDEDFEDLEGDGDEDGDDEEGDSSDEEDEEDDDDDFEAALGDLDLSAHQDFLQLLMTLDDAGTLPARFAADPVATMARIQSARPEVFAAIVQNQELFHDIMARLNGVDMHGEEDEDEDDNDGFEDEAGFLALDDAAVPLAPPGGTTPGATVPSPSGGGSTPALTERDNMQIENLMQLGFSREQVLAAYFRAGRNPDRAAGILFGA